MKILLVNQFFWPDSAATGQFLTDVARFLSREHQVTVICSGGSYAQTDDGDAPPNVRVIRIPGIRYRRGVLGRAASYAIFFVGSLWHELRMPRPDIVMTLTTPPLLSVGGTILKAVRGTRHFIWEMDLFPDALVSLGALREGSLAVRLLGWVADLSRRRCDGIIALGPCMRKRLMARGIPKERVHVVENWADGSKISPRPRNSSEKLNILYSGNFGLSHDSQTILGAMHHFRDDARFQFTFAGGGATRIKMERMASEGAIRNAHFLPYCGRDQMAEHLSQADIGLVTERTASLGTVVPSKAYGLMAAGRPILFIGPRAATSGLLVRRLDCGWQIDPGDNDGLIDLLERLSAHRELVRCAGERARWAFERYYDLPHGVAKIAAVLGLREPTDRDTRRGSDPSPVLTSHGLTN